VEDNVWNDGISNSFQEMGPNNTIEDDWNDRSYSCYTDVQVNSHEDFIDGSVNWSDDEEMA
jgi:hypothetical protein